MPLCPFKMGLSSYQGAQHWQNQNNFPPWNVKTDTVSDPACKGIHTTLAIHEEYTKGSDNLHKLACKWNCVEKKESMSKWVPLTCRSCSGAEWRIPFPSRNDPRGLWFLDNCLIPSLCTVPVPLRTNVSCLGFANSAFTLLMQSWLILCLFLVGVRCAALFLDLDCWERKLSALVLFCNIIIFVLHEFPGKADAEVIFCVIFDPSMLGFPCLWWFNTLIKSSRRFQA